ncbi:MAG: cytochrome P450, partial [Streptomycetaceae bacterium]|nr:cytochrome P450 [Streptomycetaceae bacterium]
NETTRNLIGNCLYWLASNPDLYAAVRADRGLLSVLIEESLRLDSPVQILVREAVRPTDVPGERLETGDRVVLGIASANRDETVYPEPDDFRLDRPRPRDHLAFGAGPHICPGAALARTETMAVLEQMCDQVAAFRLADDFVPQPNPVFWAAGHRSLPCLMEPAEA